MGSFVSACSPHSSLTPDSAYDGNDAISDGGSATRSGTGYNLSTGSASSLAAGTAALLFGANASQPYTSISGRKYTSLQAAHQSLNGPDSLPIAAQDTGAQAQWQAGWTGRGVKVGIVDFFSFNSRIDTHGDYVSLIVNSVAPEAELFRRDDAATDALARRAWQSLDRQGVHIINNSWGYDKAERAANGSYTGNIVTRFDADVAAAINYGVKITGNYSYHEDALFVFAAGNGAGNCGTDYYVDICNYHAAVTKGLRAEGVSDGSAFIWVGALNDAGTSMAAYSYHGGNLKHDFLVAHDNILTTGDALGTSFAAPRVAGAAALLKHKFPNLNGGNIKDILLRTAEDMGAPGVDDVYGWGKLDLANAMSPYETLAPDTAGTVR